jgi:hypothetical protein
MFDRGISPRNLIIILNTLRRMFELDRINGRKEFYGLFEQLGGIDELEKQ